MKINRVFLKDNIPITSTGDIDFSSYPFDQYHIRRIDYCNVTVTATDFDDVIEIKIKGQAFVIACCSYTLQDVPLKINFNDKLYFSDQEDNDDCYHFKGNEIDLDEYIYSLILASVPQNVTKPGSKLPEGGDGYRVIKEDDYLKEKENKKDSRWDILDTLDISD